MLTLKRSSAKPVPSAAAMSGADPIGTVFFHQERVLRGIRADKVDEVRRLIASGLIRHLEQEGLFPATAVVADELPGFAMTLEHHRLHPFALPSEWTAGMLRDAALALLEINEIARSFGYETKDAHPYNFCFVGTRPVFFDFGSFVPIEQRRPGWRAYDEFVRTILYPLALAPQLGPMFTHLLLDSGSENLMSHEDYIRLRLGASANWLPCRFLARARRASVKLRSISGSSGGNGDPTAGRHPWTRLIVDLLRDSAIVGFLAPDFSQLKRRVRALSRRPSGSPTRWAMYQLEFFDASGVPRLDHRLQRVCDLVSDLKPESVLEIGGNMGCFSLALSLRGVAPRVICTDYDGDAVESAYELFGRHGEGRCTAALVSFLEECQSIKVPSVAERYCADAVVALAITHHLVLSQGVQGEVLMRRMASFCKRYAVVEFMPLGLWDGTPRSPTPPSWYTIDWFRRHFLEEFDLLHEEQLERNRIVLVGRKRAA
jgi:hypothetical protein